MGLYRHTIKSSLSILVLLCLLALPVFVSASNTDGTIDATNKYAWGQNIGWINFGTSQGNVHVTDSQLTGYAWTENTGWINLNPSTSNYVHNDSNGTLSGYAWGEGTGYIDFTGVTIDSTGYFHGYASSTISGKISFNCTNGNSCGSSNFAVQTDWRPANSRTSSNTSSGGGVISGPLAFGTQRTSATTSSTSSPSSTLNIKNVANTVSISTSSCSPYLTNYLKFGKKNDTAEVLKLQTFLQNYGAPSLALSSVYDVQTRTAVLQFQTTYAADILGPWNTSTPTGYVFKTTLKKINQLYCTQKPVSSPSVSPVATSSSSMTPAIMCPYFTKRLIFNSQNSEVSKVQKFLKAQGLLSVGHADGSVVDKETTDAIKAFQKKYATDILVPNSLSNPTGYWINSSIKEANILMGCPK